MKYPIVRLWIAKAGAERMGREAFEGIETGRYDDITPTDHGRWDTHLLPEIRKLAGHKDRLKGGAYAEPREVFVIEHKNDQEGEIVESQFLVDELIEAFEAGAYVEIND